MRVLPTGSVTRHFGNVDPGEQRVAAWIGGVFGLVVAIDAGGSW
ncbi:hypothetical protein [Curtobacterium sp. SL109]|nr:hypothetical protein [Curtobacterium sp. SL109]MCY1694801.1 hypothetical protein [Curtobacterium sp. SL109]